MGTKARSPVTLSNIVLSAEGLPKLNRERRCCSSPGGGNGCEGWWSRLGEGGGALLNELAEAFEFWRTRSTEPFKAYRFNSGQDSAKAFESA